MQLHHQGRILSFFFALPQYYFYRHHHTSNKIVASRSSLLYSWIFFVSLFFSVDWWKVSSLVRDNERVETKSWGQIYVGRYTTGLQFLTELVLMCERGIGWLLSLSLLLLVSFFNCPYYQYLNYYFWLVKLRKKLFVKISTEQRTYPP